MSKNYNVKIAKNNSDLDVSLKENQRYLGTMVVGLPGSGKTEGVLTPMAIQDIENKRGVAIFDNEGDLSVASYVYAKSFRRRITYFNPGTTNVSYNPLLGDEQDVIDGFIQAFRNEAYNTPSYFIDINESLIRNSIKLLKRLKGDLATLLDLSDLVFNIGGEGKFMVNAFARIQYDLYDEKREAGEIALWFNHEYYKEGSKLYENTNLFRSLIGNLTRNINLRRIFIEGEKKEVIDFNKAINNEEVLIINFSSLKYDLAHTFLESLMLNNYQSALFKKNKKTPNFLYVDGIINISNLKNLILRGSSFKLGLTFSINSLSQVKHKKVTEYEDMQSLILSNIRNFILTSSQKNEDAEVFNKMLSCNGIHYSIDLNHNNITYILSGDYSVDNRQAGKGSMNVLSESELDFINKRMAVYSNEFKKK